MGKRPSELRPEWEALQQEAAAFAANEAAYRALPADDPRVDAFASSVAMLGVQKDMLAAAAWVGEVRDFADVLLLAEIVWDIFWGVGTFPDLPADIDDQDQRHVAVAYLIRGISAAAKNAGGAES